MSREFSTEPTFEERLDSMDGSTGQEIETQGGYARMLEVAAGDERMKVFGHMALDTAQRATEPATTTSL